MVPQSDNVLTIEYMIIWNTGHTETKMWKSMAITRNCSIFDELVLPLPTVNMEFN